jgi:hypothetical protein
MSMMVMNGEKVHNNLIVEMTTMEQRPMDVNASSCGQR